MTDRTIRVRPARPDDADTLTQLWLQLMAQHEAYNALHWGCHERAAEDWRKWFFECLDAEDRFVLVATDADDRPVGYLLGGTAERPPPLAVRRHGTVYGMMVACGWRGKGAGSALLDRAEALFRELGAAYVTLAVAQANEGAIRFYESRGLRTVAAKMIKPL